MQSRGRRVAVRSAVPQGQRVVTALETGDGELARLTAGGDQTAYGKLIERYLPRVLAVARRLLGDPSEADDVAQETFLRLWRKAGEIEVGPQGLAGWLYRVAANLSLDRLRARRPQDPDALELQTVVPEQGRSLGEEEMRRTVEGALQALPERQRLALVLCHYEELSMVEAGRIMDASEEAVESLLARGRRALKKSLAAVWRDLLPEEDGR
jgi:RNA polymerase sigma-70 factor (ECF subfamily)